MQNYCLKATTHTEKSHLPKWNPGARNKFNWLYETVPIYAHPYTHVAGGAFMEQIQIVLANSFST